MDLVLWRVPTEGSMFICGGVCFDVDILWELVRLCQSVPPSCRYSLRECLTRDGRSVVGMSKKKGKKRPAFVSPTSVLDVSILIWWCERRTLLSWGVRRYVKLVLKFHPLKGECCFETNIQCQQEVETSVLVWSCYTYMIWLSVHQTVACLVRISYITCEKISTKLPRVSLVFWLSNEWIIVLDLNPFLASFWNYLIS